ncbi:Hypothetical predicted protein [Paramuricea clavata]|uniref:Uncharacterized protein n=1 Tax=Paramuricea clavata TaxID=317549 RepID=A0A6S7GV40_PARCT|nr:Hypothetical predicted protein [Paramuricea clavata]
MSKVDKPELMKLNNPNYAHLVERYKHLNGAKFEDPDTRTQIPIHLVLGASDYAKIKTTMAQKVGKPGQLVAEKTLLGWTVMSPGKEGPILLTQSTTIDCEQLCALDVLGLLDRNENGQKTVYEEFEEQLSRDQAGWGILKHHLDAWEDRYPEIVKQLCEGLYVDDLITGGTTVAEIQTQKERLREASCQN